MIIKFIYNIMNIDSRVMNIIKTEKITNTDIDLLSNLDCDKQSYYRNLIISENHKIKIPSYALWRPIDITYEKNKSLWWKNLFYKKDAKHQLGSLKPRELGSQLDASHP